MSKRSDEFARNWVSENVHNVPGLEDQRPEVRRLANLLVKDASEVGIGVNELLETVGDPEDYLEGAYLNVHDPDQGGFR
jgi:hypothetical protein